MIRIGDQKAPQGVIKKTKFRATENSTQERNHAKTSPSQLWTLTKCYLSAGAIYAAPQQPIVFSRRRLTSEAWKTKSLAIQLVRSMPMPEILPIPGCKKPVHAARFPFLVIRESIKPVTSTNLISFLLWTTATWRISSQPGHPMIAGQS